MSEGLEMLGHSGLQNPKGWGCRHTLTLLGFFCFNLLYGMRVTMSIGIVAMVNHSNFSGSTADPNSRYPDGTTCKDATEATPISGASNSVGNVFCEVTKSAVQFDWDEKSQGLILGAIFWGSLIAKIPGGLVAHRYGGKWPLGLAMLGIAVMTLLLPTAAAWDWRGVLAVRVVQGLCDGFCRPAMHTILAKWAPPDERSKLGTIIYAGGQLGTAIIMVSSGYLIGENVLGGWPSPFYASGILTVVWVCFWFWLSSESPEGSPRISISEMIYIQRSIGGPRSATKSKRPVPWKDMLSSLPVWAIIVANASDAWGFYTFLTELPTYMKTVLKFNIKANSWLSALPYLISWGFAIVLTQIGDYLISRNKLSVVFVRKACETIGHFGSAIILIAATYAGGSTALVVTLVTIGIAINGATHGGYGVNHMDIAPNHAGILQAITSTVASICGIAAPYVAGLIVNGNPSAENWQVIFFLAAGIYLFDTVFYNFFASGEEQPWNKGPET